jgi:hypothetical protein
MSPSDSNQPVAPIGNADSSLWRLPGLDKDTFYAAALYLHAARGSLHGRQIGDRTIATPVPTQDFLDRFADCFAGSKLADARDHVTATAMVRSEDKKTITIYIAKNQTEKGFKPFASQEELKVIDLKNKEFADDLIVWLNRLTGVVQFKGNQSEENDRIFRTMCKFNWSRLDYYNEKLSEHHNDSLDRVGEIMKLKFEEFPRFADYQAGWKEAEAFVNKCKEYRSTRLQRLEDDRRFDLLVGHAQEAGRVRRLHHFRALADVVQALTSDKRADVKELVQIMKWIDYLARLPAIHLMFQNYCKNESQAGYRFHYKLLPSQKDEWLGRQYSQIVQSWAGNLELDEIKVVETEKSGNETETVQNIMDKVASSTNGEARVHCEMQLLMHFLNTQEKCLDYFGCSKKSCWLCWQLIVQHHRFSMKGTHRKLYPRWAFPFSFSASQPFVAEGVRVAYNDMMWLIQEKVINRKTLNVLDPCLQTSARLTPAHRRVINVDGVRPGPESEPFFQIPITVPNRFPGEALPVLHLPMNDSLGSLRQVKVHTYQKLEGDIAEDVMDAVDFGGRRILFAFQLITKPPPESSTLSEDEFGHRFWKFLSFGDMGVGKWIMYYRAGGATLEPNPRILSMWKSIHGHTVTSFPWRGDIFILNLDRSLSLQLASDMRDIDNVAALRALATLFTSQGPDFAAIVEKLNRESLITFCDSYRSKFNWLKYEASRQ